MRKILILVVAVMVHLVFFAVALQPDLKRIPLPTALEVAVFFGMAIVFLVYAGYRNERIKYEQAKYPDKGVFYSIDPFVFGVMLAVLTAHGGYSVLVEPFLKNRPTNSAEWAAWIQAYGSILAIVAALVIAMRQHYSQRALEAERQRLSDIRRLKAVKAVLTQICTLSHKLFEITDASDYVELDDFDPQFLVDYKVVLQSLPLFEIPSAEIVLFANTIPRAIDEVTVRMFEAKKLCSDPLTRYEWLVSSDIDHRVKNLCNLATTANNSCFDEINSLDGWTIKELTAERTESSQK